MMDWLLLHDLLLIQRGGSVLRSPFVAIIYNHIRDISNLKIM
jgi:hypothetical protein